MKALSNGYVNYIILSRRTMPHGKFVVAQHPTSNQEVLFPDSAKRIKEMGYRVIDMGENNDT